MLQVKDSNREEEIVELKSVPGTSFVSIYSEGNSTRNLNPQVPISSSPEPHVSLYREFMSNIYYRYHPDMPNSRELQKLPAWRQSIFHSGLNLQHLTMVLTLFSGAVSAFCLTARSWVHPKSVIQTYSLIEEFGMNALIFCAVSYGVGWLMKNVMLCAVKKGYYDQIIDHFSN